MSFDIDIAIVAIFLLLNLGVGLYYGRGVKTIQDYALGGRDFTTAALVSTIVATTVTGSLFAVGISRIYNEGLYDLLPTLGMVLSVALLARFVIPKMKFFEGSLSIADAMGKCYGNKVRMITAACAIFANLGAIAVQYKVFGTAISYFLNFNQVIIMICTGIVITFYSAFGGIRAVTFTDILQFTIFGTVIPLIGIILWRSTLGLENFNYNAIFVQNTNFNLAHIINYSEPKFWSMVMLFFYFAIPCPYPAIFQRILMSSNLVQAKKAFNFTAIILLVIILAISLIGLLLNVLKPGLKSDQLIPYIIDNYSYVGLKGFIIAGIMAMVMSSADSFINIASVLVVNDMLKSFKLQELKKLTLTRIVAILVGLCPIYLALSGRDLLEIILSTNAFYMPIVVVPLLTTLLGFRTTTKTVLYGMLAGFVTVVIWKTIGISFDPIIPAMLINLIVMMGVHYGTKQPGGWTKTEVEKIGEGELTTNFSSFQTTKIEKNMSNRAGVRFENITIKSNNK